MVSCIADWLAFAQARLLIQGEIITKPDDRVLLFVASSAILWCVCVRQLNNGGGIVAITAGAVLGAWLGLRWP